MSQSHSITEKIFSLYEQFGAEEYAGEKVSQLEHMVQSAQLAMEEGFDDEVVLAAFLHDVGHLLPVQDVSETMNGWGVMDHEKVGADWLLDMGPEGGSGGGRIVAEGTPEDVAKVEASHTGRYLKRLLK